MEVATDTLGFLDQKLKFDKESQQIFVVIFAKDTNSFTYVLLSTCFACFRRICDSDEKFEKRSTEYQNCFIFTDYKPRKVNKQVSDIKKLTRKETRKTK